MEAPHRSVRVARGITLGAALGLLAGAVEAHVVLWASAMAFARPGLQVARVELAYAVCAAACCGALCLIGLRRAPALGTTLALLLIAVFLHWVRTRLLSGAELLSARAFGWSALALATAIAAGFALGRGARSLRPRKHVCVQAVLAALALVGLGHFAVRAWAPRAQARTTADAPTAEVSEAKLPDVVFVLVDTLRADHLSCYGYERPTSPVIDAIASRGARFERAYSAAPWTRPAVASIMTSLYPSSHGVGTLWGKLSADVPTLARVMRERGYETAGFSANIQVSPTFGLDQAFDHFWTAQAPTLLDKTAAGGWYRLLRTHWLAKWLARLPWLARAVPSIGGPHARTVNEVVLDWLPQRSERPLFLYVHYIDPHTPYAPPEDGLNDVPVEDVWSLHREIGVPVQRRPYPLQEHRAASPETLRQLVRLYDAEIHYCDGAIGELLDELRGYGIDENDYIVFTSDHGEEFYDHKQWLHGNSVFDELVHIPLIVTGPRIDARTIEAPASHVDLLPTIAEWVGADVDFPVHGVSLAGLLEGRAGPDARPIFSERLERPTVQGVRFGDHKLIHVEHGDDGLWMEFDLERDPRESESRVAGGPSQQQRALMETAREGAGALRRGAAERAKPDREVEELLRALGYVEYVGDPDVVEDDDGEKDAGKADTGNATPDPAAGSSSSGDATPPKR